MYVYIYIYTYSLSLYIYIYIHIGIYIYTYIHICGASSLRVAAAEALRVPCPRVAVPGACISYNVLVQYSRV